MQHVSNYLNNIILVIIPIYLTMSELIYTVLEFNKTNK